MPLQNLEHALHTLYTQFAFVLHSFCALVNHILHMCKMCVVSKILGTCAKCAREVYICNSYVCSLHTILKIRVKYAQFAHNPQDMCKICAVCTHKKKSASPVAGHPSKHWAGPMFENQCFQCGMVSDTYSYSRRPFICAATLPKVSVLIVCNGKL